MARLEPRDHTVSLNVAAAYTKRHRGGLSGARQHGDHGGAFHADQVIKMLQQPGCTALRIYHGRSEQNEKAMVLVAVDANGNDMTKGIMMEMTWPCPPWCDDTSPLIS